MGNIITNKIKALVWLMKDPQSRGLDIDPKHWVASDINQSVLGMELDISSVNQNFDIEPPKTLNPHR